MMKSPLMVRYPPMFPRGYRVPEVVEHVEFAAPQARELPVRAVEGEVPEQAGRGAAEQQLAERTD